jgi:hypothetical protein
MIREKTRGNLTKEEEDILTKVLADLQLAFVEAGNQGPAAPAVTAAPEAPGTPGADSPPDEEDKKKFSKSYG